MINIKTKESQLELDIGFYDIYFLNRLIFFIVYTLSGQKIGIIR